MVDGRRLERTDKEPIYIELRFSPSPELIPIVRRFVSSFYERLLSHADAASRLALATHELLENTCKYSLDGISSLHLGVAPRPDGTEVSIRTWNRCSERDRDNVAAILAETEMRITAEVKGDELCLVARALLPPEAHAAQPNLPLVSSPTFSASSSFE